MHGRILTALLFILYGASITAGVTIKLKSALRQASDGFAKAASQSCTGLVKVDKHTLTVPVANTAAPWDNANVDVWNSTCTTTRANDIMNNIVECVQPQTTFRQLFANLQKEGCWMFIFGGAVRDIIRGVTPADIDAETSCELSKLLSVCKKYYGNQCWPTARILHIGGSNSTETYVDIASWNQTMFGNGTSLEYSTNSMAYEWSQHAIIDLSDHTGTIDTQNLHIRLPVPPDRWNVWASNGFEKSFRFWKLRVKGYSAADNETFNFVTERIRHLAATSPITLQQDYCKYALKGEYDPHANTCGTESNCAAVNDFDKFLQADFGDDYWNKVLKPLFKEAIKCGKKVRNSCIRTTESSTERNGVSAISCNSSFTLLMIAITLKCSY